MAEIIEEVEQPELELQEGETAGNIEEETPRVEEPAEDVVEAEEVADEEDTPEIYRGKTAAELSKILLEKEQMIGQQGSELHNLRSTLDAMALNTSKASEPEPEPITEADFFSDPTSTVNRVIESHPALRQAQEMATKMAYAQGLATLQQRHPDLKEVYNSPKFAEWIKSSPVRLARLQRADQMGDVEEADDLISTFKQLNQIEASAKEASAKAQKQAVRSANTGLTRGNSDVRGSRRIYRSADIRELHKTDPERYHNLQPEIVAAYAEGRVRD